MGLGWKSGDWKCDYRLRLPRLSEEEEEVVARVCEECRRQMQKRESPAKQEGLELAESLLDSYCQQEGLELASDQRHYLSKTIYSQTFGNGFLEELLADQSLEEIAIIGLDLPVYVYVRGEGWKKTNVALESQEYFVSLANRLARNLGRRLTAQQPRLNAVLEDGSRLHASMPPVSPCEMTIRKFGRERLSPYDLLSLGTFEPRLMAILSLAVQADLSILVCGNTASGKTSTLNALLSFVPASERILLIEETPEISIPHPHQLRLVPFEEAGISMVELVRDSLRMRPDRVVVGEVRQAGEARAFVESALSGQAKGCYSTFHAQSARDACLRLRMMGCLEADLEGISLFIVQRRVSAYDAKRRALKEKRKVTEISIANEGAIMSPRVVFQGGRFSQPALNLLISMISEGSGMPQREAREEILRRQEFFCRARQASFERSFAELQKFLFGGGGHAAKR
ncbi:MAG: ATPase, T2SS/T4P/T4SS family [Candidatus Micrarchaeota archaeon]|nr:ATPase, T2SS/T4P/T4SS family [Candidatus Micrarchaeota archaeon]